MILPFGCARVVQLPDVFHEEAFVGTPAEGTGATGPRQLLWYAEDYAGNLVAQLSDDVVAGLADDYERVPWKAP